MHVLPGDETGEYHIPVGNLPWSCTWQDLKDFTRNQDCKGNCINVEHAEVFSSSACGWVRIRGKSDFLKALKHLNGGIMENRSLIADGRNETETISLRDPANVSLKRNGSNASSATDATRFQQRQASVSMSAYSGCDNSSPQWSSSYAPSSPMSTTFPISSYTSQSLQVYENHHQPLVEPQYNYGMPLPPSGIVYAGDMAPATPIFVHSQQFQYVVPVMYSQPVAPSSSQHQSQHQTPVAMPMMNIKSKVIITQIPHSASASDLRDLIRIAIYDLRLDSSAEDPYRSLLSLRIEKHADGNRKSHAFLVFPTHEMAKAVVEYLDGRSFRGRELKAKLAKEGAEPSRIHRQQQPRTESYLMSPPPEPPRQLGPPITLSSQPSSRSNRGYEVRVREKEAKGSKVVVQRVMMPGKEKEVENKMISPVVANGTGTFAEI